MGQALNRTLVSTGRPAHWAALLLAAAAVMYMPPSAMANPLSHRDVKHFKEDLDTCEHLAGEYNPDLDRKSRRLFIEDINRYCAKANHQRAALIKKYSKDAEVAQLFKSETLDFFKAPGKSSDVAYTCSEKNSAFALATVMDAAPDDPTRQIIDGAKLTIYGPRTGQWGARMRLGTGTVTKTCGKLTIEFRGGYLNRDVYGPSGSLDFPVIQIRAGRRVLLRRTALSACEVTNRRTAYFGPCRPAGPWPLAPVSVRQTNLKSC